ncbi:MAG: TonB-dependent receptor plug domain-containing protein, partial [Verrucomicrobia bacterium]|nr:TonB-dependent receptor plug domain-containing protein [Verrucomicrobiota bacterium]
MRTGKWTMRLVGLWGWLAAAVAGLPAAEEGAVVHELEAFTVRAWHFDGVDLQYPGDVRVIDREAIEDSFTSSLPELLGQEANVRMESLTGDPTQGQVSLRGFGENSGLRVLVVVDGQRINRPDLGGVEWQLVPLEDIASLEVIRGGQNVLYGNYALAGVIKVTTRRGGPVRTNLRAEGGSDGYSRGAVD